MRDQLSHPSSSLINVLIPFGPGMPRGPAKPFLPSRPSRPVNKGKKQKRKQSLFLSIKSPLQTFECQIQIKYIQHLLNEGTTNTLDKLIKSLPTNVATGLDGISVPLLKRISPAILERLTKVLNCSIQSGICPSVLKLARVTPVHKSGQVSDPYNFRPISVLPIISKLLERHICTQLMLYLRSFNLIVSTQSGFRPHHSTESIFS